MPRLVLIHGVGPFEQKAILEAVRRLGATYGIANDDVTAFNWDKRVDRVIGANTFRQEVVSRISEGGLNAANLGFVSGMPYARIPLWYLSLLNGMFFVLQLLALGWLPFILFLNKRFTPSKTALVAAFFAASLLSATMLVSNAPGKAVRALLRRIALTLAWPLFFIFISVSGAAFYLGVVLICLGVMNYFSRFNDLYRFSTLGGFALFAAGLCVYALVRMIAMILGRPIELILSPLLKVISDVLRYIGLPEYRSRLIKECAELLAHQFAEADHVIICAHTLVQSLSLTL